MPQGQFTSADIGQFKPEDIETAPTSAGGAAPASRPMHPNDMIAGAVIGAAKGAAKSAIGLGQMVHKIPGVSRAVDALYGTPGLSQASFPAAREAVKPEGTAQQIGHTAEQIGEFFTPVGAVGKAGKVAEVAKAAALTQAQTDSPTAATVAGATSAALTAASPVVAKAAKWGAERIERALVKATKADIEDGFTAANVFKHNVGGTLEQTYQKSVEKIKYLSESLQQRLRSLGPDGEKPTIDVLAALNAAATKATGNAARTVGQNQALTKSAQQLWDELEPVLQQAGPKALETGRINLITANQLKQGVGELGAWKHDPTGRVVNADDKAMETLANAFYDELKRQIETNAVGPVKAINKEIGELLAIKHAVARRIPVEQRANVLNLGDLISMGTGTWGLSIANRILRSGQAANALSKVQPTQAPARGAAAAISQVGAMVP